MKYKQISKGKRKYITAYLKERKKQTDIARILNRLRDTNFTIVNFIALPFDKNI